MVQYTGMHTNTLAFVTHLLDTLITAQLRSWLFGGWAEEAWAIIPPRPHQDIDLLYPAPDFIALDQFIATSTHITEIRAKRFSHKRAVMYHNVMVEWLLLEPCTSGYVTHFFDGRHRFHWRHEALTNVRGSDGHRVDIASQDSLVAYRQQREFEARVRAYHAYLAHQESA